MKIKRILIPLFLSLLIPASLKAQPAKTVTIVVGDTMKFSVDKIEAQPGEDIVIILKDQGNVPKVAMGHNWILLKASANAADYARAAMTAKAEDYQPKSLAGEVIASTPLVGPNESQKVEFKAPSASGTYPYLCSFPGHYGAGMKGVLIVK